MSHPLDFLSLSERFAENGEHSLLALFLMLEVGGCRVIIATVFIVVGNIFFVSFGNHQSLSKARFTLASLVHSFIAGRVPPIYFFYFGCH